MTNDPIIKIEQLEKSFGDLHVLKGIDLEVNRGEAAGVGVDEVGEANGR